VAGELGQPGAAAIDRDFLARFTRGDLALEREVLALFGTQIPLSLQRLSAASGRGWKEAAHTIKGSAAAIGAWQLAHAAACAEAIDAADPAARADVIAALSCAAAEVCRSIDRLPAA
jgi:HPt (histidine-containing phosphotransfer) domain-containing protein